MTQPNTVTVHIMDKEYCIACPPEERSNLEGAARYLDRKMREIRSSGKVIGADRVAVMMGGKLLQIDTPTAIYNDPRHIEVAQFIGTPRINILEALVSDNGMVHFAGRAILQDVAAHSGTTIRIGIRPEHFQLKPHDKTGIAGTRGSSFSARKCSSTSRLPAPRRTSP